MELIFLQDILEGLGWELMNLVGNTDSPTDLLGCFEHWVLGVTCLADHAVRSDEDHRSFLIVPIFGFA